MMAEVSGLLGIHVIANVVIKTPSTDVVNVIIIAILEESWKCGEDDIKKENIFTGGILSRI